MVELPMTMTPNICPCRASGLIWELRPLLPSLDLVLPLEPQGTPNKQLSDTQPCF